MFRLSSTPNQPGNTQGICITCRHVHDCSIRKAALLPLWTCSRYEDEEEETPGTSDNAYEENEKIPGLCMNCDLVKHCSLRREGQVIFHCEEYV